MVRIASIRRRASPSSIESPTRAFSAAGRRSSTQTLPGAGPCETSRSAYPSSPTRCDESFGSVALAAMPDFAMRNLPRSGYPSLTALTAESCASSPVRDMLGNEMLSAIARPRDLISARKLSSNGLSALSSKSPPRSWWASRTSARVTRSAKNEILVTLVTATIRASASTRNSPARQSRMRCRSASFIPATLRPPPVQRQDGCADHSARPAPRRA